ncbi:MAG TPA: hypothetical protein VFR07_00670 [Mycobacteriales bacterium]|nr:hypothetical protein [Mycobacteriales bacterium]
MTSGRTSVQRAPARPLPCAGPAELRRGVLAVSVLHDIDVEPADDGVRLVGSPPVWVSWAECRRALAGSDPEDEDGRRRLTDWLQARRWVAGAGRAAVTERLTAVGLPVDHLLHPGLDWVQERVLGDALDLGLGAVDLDPADPDRVVLLPRTALDACRIDADCAWLPVRDRLEELGRLAVELLAHDPRGQLRPVGHGDVVTLLGSRELRRSLASAHGGMAPVIVPMRRRGWSRLALIDPAFGPAAAAATGPADRGFARPLLVTEHEVSLVPIGGRSQLLAVRQPAADAPVWGRDVRRR